MRIEYENRFSDIILFHAIHQFLSPPLQGLYLLFFAFVFWNELGDSGVFASATTALLWYAGLWLFQFLFNVIYLYSTKNHSILTKHTVEIQDDAFFEETKFNKSFFYWFGVVKAVSRPGFVAVYVSQHMAHIIPNRAFASSAQRSEFIALVKAKIHVASGEV